MAYAADRVKETSATGSTGSFALAGASAGYQSFNTAFATGSIVYYAASDTTNNTWEIGQGTFTSPSTLSRDVILSSSNSGAVVNFAAVSKDIFCTSPAGSVNGQFLAVTQASHGFTAGNVLSFNGTSYAKIQSNTTTPLVPVGIVSRSIGTNTFMMTTSGVVTGLSGLTAGAMHYISDSVAGSLTTTAPTADTSSVIAVLFGLSTTSGIFIPTLDVDGHTSGTATLDFGSGDTDTSVAVTGQTGITTVSKITTVRIKAVATANHTIDETYMENVQVYAGNIVAGTGFTIYGKSTLGYAIGQFTIEWTWV